jgi:effector-binding domain-containing protein
MSNKCEIIERVAQPSLSIRTRAAVQDLPRLLGESYGKLMQYLGELGETPAGAPYVAYFTMDMQNLDMEIGFPVLSPLPGKGELQAGFLPAGKSAACHYTGPYNEVASAYNDLSAWIAAQGVQPTGVAYEFYLNDPKTTPSAELQTLILFPLA